MQESMLTSNVASEPKSVESNFSQQMQGFWKYPTNLAPPAPVVTNQTKPNTETLITNMMGLMQQLMMNMKQAWCSKSIESNETTGNIPVIQTENRTVNQRGRGVNKTNNHTIKRSDKAVQALKLPSVAIINPRSLYNKVEELVSFVKETVEGVIEIVFVTETFERPQFNLNELLEPFEEMEEYEIVSNPH